MIRIIIFLFLTMVVSPIFAAPQFKDYAAQPYKRNNKPFKVDQTSANFKTKFAQLSKQEVNFAGHYVITFVGCGGGCIMGLIYNAKTGKGDYLPIGTIGGCYTEDGYLDPEIDYQKNSRLFRVFGQSADSNHDDCSTQYFLINNIGFKLIHKEIFQLK